MIAAHRPDRPSGKLLVVDADGGMQHLCRADLATLFRSGDLVVANDAATLPASLRGEHERTGDPIEIRLAAFVSAGDPTRFVAIAFGAGDHHTLTEDRALPPVLSPGDRLLLGPLVAVVERLVDHPRLPVLRFQGDSAEIFAACQRLLDRTQVGLRAVDLVGVALSRLGPQSEPNAQLDLFRN